MSKFLDGLLAEIDSCRDSHNNISINDVKDTINSLGENARRMIAIGIVQDELVKLGFYHHDGCGVTICEMTIQSKSYDYLDGHKVRVYFGLGCAGVHSYRFDYDDPNWQQNLVNKVKELIN